MEEFTQYVRVTTTRRGRIQFESVDTEVLRRRQLTQEPHEREIFYIRNESHSINYNAIIVLHYSFRTVVFRRLYIYIL